MSIAEIKFLQKIGQVHKNRSSRVTQGIGDDAALIDIPGPNYLILTTDTLVENNHFSFKWYSIDQVGYKAVESNVSDIAAMGGRPTFMLIAISKPKDFPQSGLLKLQQAIEKRAAKYRISIVGGDITSNPTDGLVITITLLGEVKKGQELTMNKVKAGDQIMVTGNLGGSGAALAYLINPGKFKLTKSEIETLTKFQNEPHANLKAGQCLSILKCVTSATDVSDGLASDLRKIIKDKKIGFKIYPDKIPVHSVVKKIMKQLNKPFFDSALYGGEDFELVFTVSAPQVKKVTSTLKCYHVGEVIKKTGIYLLTKDGKEIEAGPGYDQFMKNEYGW